MQLLHWKVCAVRIGQNWPVCWKHPCCRVSRPPSGEHHPCLTFRALITYWIKRNSNLGLWKDSVWCTTHLCPLTHITDMFPQSRTVQVILSFTFVLEKVHFLHRLEAEATSDTSTHYEHNAELKASKWALSLMTSPSPPHLQSQRLWSWPALWRAA